jgi:uncharacterized damage-inducible protein DinB
MSANPYAAALAARDAAQMLAETPARWRAYVAGLSAEEVARVPAPGKWSLREVLCHLADCELAFGFRMRQVYAGEALIQTFDQDAWARSYAAYTAAQALETFLALRTWNTAFVNALTVEDRERTAHHPERGDLSLGTVVEMLAGHDLHHLEKLERLGA